MTTGPQRSPRSRYRRLLAPFLLFGLLGVLVVLFRHVLLPFILALIIVYLMEPVVKRIHRIHVKRWHVPRWIAVIIVFLAFFGTVSTFSVLVIPPLVTELGSLAEEAPKFFEELRTEHIPELNRDLQELIERLFPVRLTDDQLTGLKDQVHTAADRANLVATMVGSMTPEMRDMYLQGALVVSLETGEERIAEPAALRLQHDPETDEWLVYLEEVEVIPDSSEEGRFILQTGGRPERQAAPETRGFDLERSINEELEGMLAESGSEVTRVVSLGQGLAVGVISAFVKLILTFMIAAFISIDLPRIHRYFRSIVPERNRAGYDDLMKLLDRGLAGVVRGQLLVCVINGTLTAIGLLLFDVKFALVLAVFATILSLIPIFGTIISTIPAVGMALPQGITTALLVLGWILMIHFIEANILNPKIIGTSAHIHPVIVVFALLAGEHAFGLMGALLAVPVASIILNVVTFIIARFQEKDEKEPATEENTS